MRASRRESTLDRVLRGLGRVLENFESGRHGKGGADLLGDAQRVAVAWAVGRTLRPRRVNWPRLIAATATGVVLGEALEALTARRRDGRALPPGRSRVVEDIGYEGDFGLEAPPSRARAEAAESAAGAEAESAARPQRRGRLTPEEEEARVHAFLERAGADLAVAAAYASVVYPRLPGPPMLRAIAFGAADVMVSGSGGIAATLADLSPRLRLRLPLTRLLPPQERRLARAVALALALGLIYRDDDED